VQPQVAIRQAISAECAMIRSAMKSLVRGILCLVGACGLSPLSVGCASESGANVQGGRAGTGGTGAIEGDTPCLRACSNFARFCGDPTCFAVCAAIEATYDEPLCSSEAKAHFDCIATLQASDFDCGIDAGDVLDKSIEALMTRNRTDKCDAQYTAFSQCRLTGGADCEPEPVFDDSCAITDSTHPHFQFCKIDVPMPANCVAYSSASAGWYCCE
jgi:hypothetical protein